MCTFLSRQSLIYWWLKKMPPLENHREAHASLFFSGPLIMKYLLSVSSSRFVLSSIRLELLKNNRLFVLIFHSNYLLSAFSGVMWFIQLGKIIYNELPSSLHLFVWCLVCVCLCWQVPQESGHLPGVKRQHKDQLCHQHSRNQWGGF